LPSIVGRGAGLAPHGHPFPPSIFIVGDLKQSISDFATPSLVAGDASDFLPGLRSYRDVRRLDLQKLPFRAGAADVYHRRLQDVENVPDPKRRFEYVTTIAFPVSEDASRRKSSPGRWRIPERARAAVAPRSRVSHRRARPSSRDVGTGLETPSRAGDVAISLSHSRQPCAFEDALVTAASPYCTRVSDFSSPRSRDFSPCLGFLPSRSNLRAAACFDRDSCFSTRPRRPPVRSFLRPAAQIRPKLVLRCGGRSDACARSVACRRWLARVMQSQRGKLLDLAADRVGRTPRKCAERARVRRARTSEDSGLVRRAQTRLHHARPIVEPISIGLAYGRRSTPPSSPWTP